MSYLSANYLAPWGLSVASQFLWELLETELVEWLNLISFHICIDSRIKILLGKLPWWHFSKYCIYACSLIVFLLAISVNLSSRVVWPPVLSYLRLTSTLPPFPNPFKIWYPILSFFFCPWILRTSPLNSFKTHQLVLVTSSCSPCGFFYNLFYWHFQTDPSTTSP